MGAVDIAAYVAAIGTATAVVLADIRAYDRPAVRPPAPPPEPRVAPSGNASMLGELARVEPDDDTAWRRVGAAVLLLVLTLLTAGLLGAAIYRSVSNFGS